MSAEAILTGPGAAAADRPRVRVAEIQRTRLLNAAVHAIDEVGYTDVAVSHITARARVSRRTFYDLFENREDCLGAVLDGALARIDADLDAAGLRGLPWRERVRGGLQTILGFFDREPALARACVVQAARGSERLLERRAAIFTQLAGVLDQGRAERPDAIAPPPLTAEGLVGAAHAIVYERLLRRSPEPLSALLPQLMGMIALPYLGSAAARRELSRPAPASAAHDGDSPATAAAAGEDDCLRNIPMRLTYRTVMVLQAIAASPGVSNRVVGEAADISDQGQISKLLARLQRLGLIDNGGRSHVKGEANAWRLTSIGERVTQSIRVRAGEGQWAA